MTTDLFSGLALLALGVFCLILRRWVIGSSRRLYPGWTDETRRRLGILGILIGAAFLGLGIVRLMGSQPGDFVPMLPLGSPPVLMILLGIISLVLHRRLVSWHETLFALNPTEQQRRRKELPQLGVGIFLVAFGLVMLIWK